MLEIARKQIPTEIATVPAPRPVELPRLLRLGFYVWTKHGISFIKTLVEWLYSELSMIVLLRGRSDTNYFESPPLEAEVFNFLLAAVEPDDNFVKKLTPAKIPNGALSQGGRVVTSL